MSPAAAFRWTGAAWFLPALFALTCLSGAADTVRTGYAVADIASTSLALYLAGPLTAGFMAARFRRFPAFSRSLRSRRSGLVVVLVAWWPVIAGAPITVCLAVLSSARDLPADMAAWGLLGVDFMTVLACALVGVGFSWALPVVVAVPAVTVLWFGWLAYPPGTSWVVLHNVSSTFAACCDASTRPAAVAIRAVLVLMSGLCGGVALLLVRAGWAARSRAQVAGLLIILLGAAPAGAVLVARSAPLTLQAVEPRSTALDCSVLSGIRVCVWPENRGRGEELAAIASRLNVALQRLRLPEITRLAQAGRGAGAISVQASAQLGADDLRYSMAAGYVDQASGCQGAVGPARDQRVALVSAAAGLGPDALGARFGPTVAALARSRWAEAGSSPARVGRWFETGLGSIGCARR